MSYDLEVYSRRSLTGTELAALVAGSGLAIDDRGGGGATTVTIVRGVKARYSFTLGVPAAVESEDVPGEVTAVLLGATWLYEVVVEGSSPTETPHAVRFARRLADATTGVVLDRQTGQVWARGKLREVAPVTHGKVDIVELRWYSVRRENRAAVASAWLSLARRVLPEALPRRFGAVEPLAGKLDADGPSAFVDAVAAETNLLFFKASNPCIAGHFTGGSHPLPVHAHSLSVHRGSLDDARWREALQRFFISFAQDSGAFFASAEVQRGLEWSGRAVGYTSQTERTVFLAGRGGWAGLPPYPVWWAWFGPEYVPLVGEHLDRDRDRRVGTGLFHTLAERPVSRDDLEAAVGRGGDAAKGPPRRFHGFRRASSAPGPRPTKAWLPSELLATVDAQDPRLYNPPLIRASEVPPELRGTG